MYFTYVLRSAKDFGFYVGFTKDLKLRFEQHQKGSVESTKDRRPLRLIYYEACLNEQDAKAREKYLKTSMGMRVIKKQLANYLLAPQQGHRSIIPNIHVKICPTKL